MRTRWLGLSLLVTLSACASTAPDVSGTWRDEAAAFTTCSKTFPVAVGLDLSQTGLELQGTFTLQGASSPFDGEVEQGRITGEVRGDDGSALEAALTPRGGRLVGTFTAIGEIGCTDGSSSRTVYNVELVR